MSASSQPSPSTAGGGRSIVQCAHCGEDVRHCPGDAALPKWDDPGPTLHVCKFRSGYLHSSGPRKGSHLCGQGDQTATPAARRQ